MLQVEYRAFGQPSQVAQLVDKPEVGPPSAWEVVVDVEAFPINPADLAMLSGNYGKLPQLPAPIGMEGVARVVECGNKVTGLIPGDRVVVLSNNNWCQRRKVAAAAVHKVPTEGDVAQFAMLKVNPATALMLLTRFVDLQPQEPIIQTAPLSSVGRCVMQIARARGWRTVNVVRRPEAKSDVIAAGGDVALEDGPGLADRIRQHLGNRPIRLALDAVGGPGVQRLAECLTEGGKIINYGMLSGEPCVLAAEQTIFRQISLTGFWLTPTLNRLNLTERTELFDGLSAMLTQGTIQMAVDSQYPLSDLTAALRRAEQGSRSGKVIVMVS